MYLYIYLYIFVCIERSLYQLERCPLLYGIAENTTNGTCWFDTKTNLSSPNLQPFTGRCNKRNSFATSGIMLLFAEICCVLFSAFVFGFDNWAFECIEPMLSLLLLY